MTAPAGYTIGGWRVELPLEPGQAAPFEAVFLLDAEERARQYARNNHGTIEPLYRKAPPCADSTPP
jgi:hypothetical protein